MTLATVLKGIRENHGDCCITDSYGDRGCKIDIRDFDKSKLTTIHGDEHQKHHGLKTKLCDRLIFGQRGKVFVCSVELKGGKNVSVSKAILQVQGGLNLARDLLNTQSDCNWYPILAYSGSMDGRGVQLLRARTVSFRGKRKAVVRKECGFNLHKHLSQTDALDSS